jgi:hypothetical protein
MIENNSNNFEDIIPFSSKLECVSFIRSVSTFNSFITNLVDYFLPGPDIHKYIERLPLKFKFDLLQSGLYEYYKSDEETPVSIKLIIQFCLKKKFRSQIKSTGVRYYRIFEKFSVLLKEILKCKKDIEDLDELDMEIEDCIESYIENFSINNKSFKSIVKELIIGLVFKEDDMENVACMKKILIYKTIKMFIKPLEYNYIIEILKFYNDIKNKSIVELEEIYIKLKDGCRFPIIVNKEYECPVLLSKPKDFRFAVLPCDIRHMVSVEVVKKIDKCPLCRFSLN